MKLFNIQTLWQVLFALLAVMGTVSCDDAIYDYEGDCSVTYRVKFSYDLNMCWTDEFAQQVNSVRLYAFDSSGNLVWSGTESGDALSRPGYTMELPLPAGQYDLVAWGGGEGSFDIPSRDRVNTLSDLIALMNRVAGSEGAYSDKDLSPLFHGMMRVELPEVYGTTVDVSTIPLMKNTNRIHVELRHKDGRPLDPASFVFTITDANGKMNYDNSLLADESITYHPWQDVRSDEEDESRFYVSMTTGRLMEDSNMRLVVKDAATGKVIIDFLLIDYLVMAKDQYSQPMSAQEYLNREDEYYLTFTIEGGEDPDPDPDPDPDYNWYINAGIFINSWHIVLQNTDL